LQLGVEADHERRSAAELLPLLWNASSAINVSFDINVLPLKTQINQRVPGSPSRDYSFKLEITFCVRGVITEPCGVPVCGSDHWPSSITPAFNHFRIRRRMRGSATRCSMNWIIQLLSRLWWVGTSLAVKPLVPVPPRRTRRADFPQRAPQVALVGGPSYRRLECRHRIR
jgi:hypothetical protein